MKAVALLVFLLIGGACVSPRDDCLGKNSKRNGAYQDALSACEAGVYGTLLQPFLGEPGPPADVTLYNDAFVYTVLKCWEMEQEKKRCKKMIDLPLRPDL